MKDLKFIGTGGAYNLEFGGNSAFIKDNDKLLLIDCCEEATAKLYKVNAFAGIKEIIVAITHTHSDHMAGLGTFIWYSNFLLNIKPKIISNTPTFENRLKDTLTLLGVDGKYYEFVDCKDIEIDDCVLEMIPTTHKVDMEAFGIMFTDDSGKYYYTGDTNDIEFVKKLAFDNNIKKIYSECSWESYGSHIDYRELLGLPKDKFVLMHFEDVKLYDHMKSQGFVVANKE